MSSSKLNRRQILKGFGLAAAGVALAACQAPVAPAPGAADAPAPAPEAAGEAAAGDNTVNLVFDGRFPNIVDDHPALLDTWCGSRLASINQKDNTFIPDAAESWEVSDDARVYTFRLRPNLKFHDGVPVTVEDVEWSYTTWLNPDTGSWLGAQLIDLVGAKDFSEGKTDKVAGIKVLDEQTIQFELEEPSGVWLLRSCRVTIHPKHLLGDIAPADLMTHELVTTTHTGMGPFIFKNYIPDQSLEVVANPDYHLGKPQIDRVLFRFSPDSQTTMLAVEKGEVDSTQISIDELARFEAMEHITVVPLRGGVPNWISVNLLKPEFQDKRFRQAVAYAINKDELINTIWMGQATPAYGHFLQDWAKSPNVNHYDYNPDKAKELLAEVGWDSGRAIDLTYYYTDNFTISLLEAMQAYLDMVGIKVELRQIDGATVRREVDEEGSYDWLYGALGCSVDPDQTTAGLDSTMVHPRGANRPRYNNPRVDELLAQGRQLVDQAGRQPIYWEIDEIVNDELPYIWLWEPNRPDAINKRVVGMAENAGRVYNMPPYMAAETWQIQG